MTPFAMNPLILLGAALIAVVIGFGGGWTANGWRLNTKIAEIKEQRAADLSAQSKAALDDLTVATKKINAAAQNYNVDIGNFSVKIDSIRKELKNVQKNKPLSDLCHADADRLRILESAISATNKAAAGQ